MGKNRIIQLGIPEGFDADEVVITLHRRIAVQGEIIEPKDGPPAKSLKEIKLLSQGKEERVCPCGVKFTTNKANQKYHTHACCVKFGNAKRYTKPKSTHGKHSYRKWDDAYIIQNFGVIPLAMMSEHLGIDIVPLNKRVYYLKQTGKIGKDVVNAGKRYEHAKYRTFSADERKYVEDHMEDDCLAIATHLDFKKQDIKNLKYRIRKAQGTNKPQVGNLLCQYCQKQCKTGRGRSIHEIWCDQNPENMNSGDQAPPDPLAAESSAASPEDSAAQDPPAPDAAPPPESYDKHSTAFDPEEKEPLWKQAYYKFKSDDKPAEDFDPKQRFGLDCYVWHQPGKEIGKIIARNGEGNFEIDFHGTIKTFMPTATQYMFEEMMRKFGNNR